MSHETLLQNYPPLFGELVPGVQLVKRRAMMNRTIVSEELKKRRGAWVGLHNELHATRPKPRSFSLCCYFRAVFYFAPFDHVWNWLFFYPPLVYRHLKVPFLSVSTQTCNFLWTVKYPSTLIDNNIPFLWSFSTLGGDDSVYSIGVWNSWNVRRKSDWALRGRQHWGYFSFVS